MYQFTEQDIQDAKLMRVHLDKGTNFFATFFTLLSNKRKEIGDEALSDYCFYHVRVSLKIIMRISAALEEFDELRVQEEMKLALEIEKQKKQEERKQEEERKNNEKLDKLDRELELKKKLLEKQEEIKKTDKKMAEKKKPKKAKADKPANQGNSTSPKPPQNKKPKAPGGASTLDVLAVKAHEILDRIDENKQQWINSTIELMTTLRQARDDCGTNNNAFGEWFESSGLEKRMNRNDRQALLNMSNDIEAARKELETTDRWSWPLIWQDMKKEASPQDDNVVPLRATPEAG